MPDFNVGAGTIAQNTTSTTIAQSASTSATIDLRGMAMVGILMPSAFTGTSMTFTGSYDGTNFFAIYNTAGTQLAITVSTSRWILFSAADFIALPYLQLVSGGTEAALRTIIVQTRSLT